MLAVGRPDDAAAAFRHALEYLPGLGRASLGLAVACERMGDHRGAAAARGDLREATAQRKQTQRSTGAMQLEACTAAVDGDAQKALATLSEMTALEPPSFIGWTIPIDPSFETLRQEPGFISLIGRLAERAT